ncbi:PAS sensor protein [Aduncisulcus paluster]|uniref:PAS sensor protein n=1 Tax=Aduncisulcus paluster TaxID=2918883 RepID=A0ABQ5K9Q9_9EUKA|nr:PAS sensor protein [Aduncisulcus paluster]
MIEAIDSSQKGTNSELSILLVEDSEDNRMVIDLFLKDTPYKITYAENGQEDAGHGRLRSDKSDTTIRRGNGLTPTPIMALTANAFQDDEQRALASGCTAHMAKPVKKKKLLRVLKEYLGSSS